MKGILGAKLRFFARLILRKYRPRIIAITGSVGKTSAKEAIFAVVSGKFSAWKSPSNYNNELGVPLSIIGVKAAGKSFFRWLAVFARAKRMIFFPYRYPKALVLEMGADHVGDIRKLTALARPSVAVVTAVSPAHLEFFGTMKHVIEEKGSLVEALAEDGVAILNRDDDAVFGMAALTRARKITFGFREGADVQAVEMSERPDGGVAFKLRQGGSTVPVTLLGVAGRQHVYAALAAAAVGKALGMNLVEIAEALRKYQAPPGRMRVLSGIKESLVIDDTYNSSPRAALEALLALERMAVARNGARGIAVLGDMLELGTATEDAHREVGARAAKTAQVVAGVGEAARFLCDQAVKSGMPQEKVFHFHTAAEAGHWLQDEVKSGDVVLVKGSQGVRMERIVKEVMAEPLRAKELLVRQSDEWQG